MHKQVNKTQFWKERIELAKKQGKLHYSVYLANDTLWKTIYDAHKEVIEKVIPKESKVLDLGCGYGRMSPLFDNYIGVDFSPEFIEEAKELYPDKKFLIADFKDMPFLDEEFDWGIMISIKNMIVGNLGQEEWNLIEKECKRVCKNILLLEYGEKEDYTDTPLTISNHIIL